MGGGTASGYSPTLFISSSGVVSLPLDVFEVFLVHGTDQGVERLERGAADAVPPGIGIDRDEHDRRLAAHRPVLPVEPQRVPAAPRKFGARRHEGVIRSPRMPCKVRRIRVFLGELCEPCVLTLLLELVAKGGSQFFAVPSTNCTSEVPTRLAAR